MFKEWATMRTKMYNKGQVIIPAEFRKKYNLSIGDYLEVVPDENCIRLIPIQNVAIVDQLFGILRENGRQNEITDLMIDKITENELNSEWTANESN
jgi:AbrB family looped-hinge helix DNA binding protein